MGKIRIKGLEKSFGENRLFNGFDLKVDKGEIVAVKGETGIGKTTLKRCISGLEEYQGDIESEGDISYLFQDSRMMPWLSVRKNLFMPFKLKGVDITPEKKKEVEQIASKFGVREHLDKEVDEISGGQKQRLLQVRALVTDPDILLLDEPFRSLDQKTRRDIYETVLDHCRQKDHTVLMASHMEDIERIADRTVNMEEMSSVSN